MRETRGQLMLYQRTDCPFCWKVRLALAYIGLSYHTINMRLGETSADLVRLSPSGTVPVLVDAETVIWDSAVILEYLDSRFPRGRLYPRDIVESTRVRLLQLYSDKQVGAALRSPVFEIRSKPEARWDRELIQRGREQWRLCQAWLERELGEREFFGNEFGAADCALAARCGVAEAYGMAIDEEYTNFWRWFTAVKSFPAWEAAYPESFIRNE